MRSCSGRPSPDADAFARVVAVIDSVGASAGQGFGGAAGGGGGADEHPKRTRAAGSEGKLGRATSDDGYTRRAAANATHGGVAPSPKDELTTVRGAFEGERSRTF